MVHDPGLSIATGPIPLALTMIVSLAMFPISLVVTLLASSLFRRTVARSMAARAGAVPPATPARSAAYPRSGDLDLVWIDARTARPAAATRAAQATVRRKRLGALRVHLAATSACALIVAAMWLIETERPAAEPASFLLYLVFTLVLSTPVALTAALVMSHKTAVMILAALLPVAAIVAVDSAFGLDTLRLWGLLAAVPTGMILLLHTRRLRSVGPSIHAACILACIPVVIGQAYLVLGLVELMGGLRFVREDLAHLPIEAAAAMFLRDLAMDGNGLADGPLRRLLSDPLSHVTVADPDALPSGAGAWILGVLGASVCLGATLAWLFLRTLGKRYRQRRASDRMLMIDVVVIASTMPMVFLFSGSAAPAVAAGTLLALIAYWLISRHGLRRQRAASAPAKPSTLLFLRVFGFDRRSQRLLDDLGRDWRYLGPIQLIAGPDCAYATIQPHEFFEFLAGRLASAFINGPADLEARIMAERATPDPDGLYRTTGFFCHDDTWLMTMARLARDADAVLMDLRGFGPDNQGCIQEIGQLMETVDVARTILLSDHSTDRPFLVATLRHAWRSVSKRSPNASPGPHRLRVLDIPSARSEAASAALALIMDDVTARTTQASQR